MSGQAQSRKVEIDGYRFDSAAEAVRYAELRLLAWSKLIGELQVHPLFVLEVNGKRICTYEADFAYVDELGRRVVEDCKPPKRRDRQGHVVWSGRTAVYQLKKRLMWACLGIKITEVER